MLTARVWTGFIVGAVVIAATLLGGLWYETLMLVICSVGFWELLAIRGIAPFRLPAVAGWLVLYLCFFSGTGFLLQPHWFMLLLFIFLLIPVLTKNDSSFADAAFIWFGSLWIGLSFYFLLQLRLDQPNGFWLFLFVLLTIWATDIGAYFVGRWLKGPKIWPVISPNKTVAGTLGGIVFAFLVGVLFSIFHSNLAMWGLFSVLLSALGQLGDFAESALKRTYGVKDSGRLLPGHGGMLDRFDSLIVAGPAAYLLSSHLISLFSGGTG
ncbi:MAG: hypothetical protein JWN30_2061 [Bacilli bacterium]|nr:hypothetical protein [Bacilli bacterium]